MKSFNSCVVQSVKRFKSTRSPWAQRQINDPFVRTRGSFDFVSRAAFKLASINDSHRIFSHGNIVVDLGASPGGWSQVATRAVTSSGKSQGLVISVDMKDDIISMPGNVIVIGDACTPEVQKKVTEIVEAHGGVGRMVDVVVSDMAHSFIGNRTADVARMDELSRDAFRVAENLLKNKGVFVCKVLTGDCSDNLFASLQPNFSTIKRFKPEASRKESAELYFVCKDSTGYACSLGPPSSLCRTMVLNFIDEIRQMYPNFPIEFHVFSRSRPEYLFGSSSKNTSKHILSDDQLVKWWKRALGTSKSISKLGHTVVQSQNPHESVEKFRGYWFIPGETETSLPGIRNVGVTGDVNWEFGFPREWCLPLENSIPLFPDDPKKKVFDLLAKNASTEEFGQVLEIVGDCSSERTCFFVIQFPSLNLNTNDELFDNLSQPGKEFEICIEDLDLILRECLSKNFSSSSDIALSSKSVIELLDSLKIVGKEFHLETKQEKLSGKKKVNIIHTIKRRSTKSEALYNTSANAQTSEIHNHVQTVDDKLEQYPRNPQNLNKRKSELLPDMVTNAKKSQKFLEEKLLGIQEAISKKN
ncbi:rRNA methyltransferase 2, mitochondrial [Nowakowskiella sp. JEL0078]|nr:rRNA methyltransferase 2, mitochondrial [Nowakowskiella sp. JEL0078]